MTGGNGTTELRTRPTEDDDGRAPAAEPSRRRRLRPWATLAVVAVVAAGGVVAFQATRPPDVDLHWASTFYVDAPGIVRVGLPGVRTNLIPPRPGQEMTVLVNVVNAGSSTVRITDLPHVETEWLDPVDLTTLETEGLKRTEETQFVPFDLEPEESRHFLWTYRWRSDCTFGTDNVDVEVTEDAIRVGQGSSGWETQEATYEVGGSSTSIRFDLPAPVSLVGVHDFSGPYGCPLRESSVTND